MGAVDGGGPGAVWPLELELVGVAATEALGEALAELAVAGDVLALEGDLGAGKTALVRGLARGLGIDDSVASPTYVLMDALEGGRLPLYHFDAWLEGREKALFLDGGDDWLRGGGLAVVEWAGRVAAWLPVPRLEVRLAHVDLGRRRALLSPLDAPEGEAGVARAGAVPGWSARLERARAALAARVAVAAAAGSEDDSGHGSEVG